MNPYLNSLNSYGPIFNGFWPIGEVTVDNVIGGNYVPLKIEDDEGVVELITVFLNFMEDQ